MRKVRVFDLSDSQRAALEQGYQHGDTHVFRQRCQLILLKEEGRSAIAVGHILGMCENTVLHWLNRYRTEGVDGLRTKSGRGRKSLLSKEKDGEKLRQAVSGNRNSLQAAKAEFDANGGPNVSVDTLRRFLKALTDDTDA